MCGRGEELGTGEGAERKLEGAEGSIGAWVSWLRSRECGYRHLGGADRSGEGG